MSSKTISLSLDAYSKLVNARRTKNESFSQVVLRGAWPEETITEKQLLNRIERNPPGFTDTELDTIDKTKISQTKPVDKWNAQ